MSNWRRGDGKRGEEAVTGLLDPSLRGLVGCWNEYPGIKMRGRKGPMAGNNEESCLMLRVCAISRD